MVPMSTLRTQKQTLRKSLSSLLKSLPASSIADQSQIITSRILSLPSFQECKTVSCYLSMPSGEVDTSLLVSNILRAGKTLFVPKIVRKDGYMDLLRVYGEEDLNSFPPGVWGIKEPGLEWQGSRRENILADSSGELDLILFPGVAFDRSLSRLGHGKGYYDRFVESYLANGRPRPHFVALALREQVLEKDAVPMGEHDWKMDFVVTPDEVIALENTIE